ncbi:MAG: hypothetical protein PHN39_02560 [Candidatus Pacebacteria bacterium]|nr:hypothetical protein [Candidatus Paceibacterota bacterium]
MKIYLIIITIIAVLAIVVASYFYWQVGQAVQKETVCQVAQTTCQADKAQVENQLSRANGQLATVRGTAAVLEVALNSFMIPGDLTALTIGSREAIEVGQKIEALVDSGDRMMAEKDWSDFKSSLRLNALFGLLRNLANNLDRNLQPTEDSSPLLQPTNN